jgi:formyl-CoA transferase
LNYQLSGEVPERMGSRTAITAPRNVYPCKDGRYVALSASMQGMVERLFHAIGQPELIDNPRFRTNSDRVANNDELDALIATFMAQHTQDECLQIFTDAQVTVGPVCDIAQLMEHPFIQGREVLVEVPDPDLGTVPMHNVTPRLSGTPGSIRTAAPVLGQHNAALLAELGLDAAAIERLAADGVISDAPTPE